MNFEAMFFDLDDTLYPATSGVWQAIGDRMDLYMHEILGFEPDEVRELRENLFWKYGTTLRGLKSVYNIDEFAFLDFVHTIPLEKYLCADQNLINTLRQYSERKIIFTNANRDHAERVIKILGLDDVFDQIIDILQISPHCKPFPEAFMKAFELSGINNPNDCVLIDDSARNLVTARQFGIYTIQVGTQTRTDAVDAAVHSLVDLPSVIPVNVNLQKAG